MALSAQERAESRAKFEEYRRTGDRKLRNELIEAHKSLASHLARRYANRGEPFDDLLQVAYLGMLKAVERFDPDRNLEFSTSATRRGRYACRGGRKSCTSVSATSSTSCHSNSRVRREFPRSPPSSASAR